MRYQTGNSWLKEFQEIIYRCTVRRGKPCVMSKNMFNPTKKACVGYVCYRLKGKISSLNLHLSFGKTILQWEHKGIFFFFHKKVNILQEKAEKSD